VDPYDVRTRHTADPRGRRRDDWAPRTTRYEAAGCGNKPIAFGPTRLQKGDGPAWARGSGNLACNQ